MGYQHIVVAAELTAESEPVIAKAAEVAKETGAVLSLVHAVETVPTYGYGYNITVGIQDELMEVAEKTMSELCKTFSVPEDNCYIEQGAPKTIILDRVKALGADLVIIGSHGRHGLGKLLGSTANAVVNGADCDVLTVRYQD